MPNPRRQLEFIRVNVEVRPVCIIKEKIMSNRGTVVFAAAFAAAVTLVGSGAWAASMVNVSLWDKGGTMDLSKSMGLGMGMHADMMTAIMGIKISRTTVPAGKVTFNVKNISKETIHEMLIAPVKDENGIMPFVDNEDRVNEDKSGDLGEVSELDPGKSGNLTLELKPGTYLLFCNVPGHYMAGMWATLKVK
jgi:uncharacterized cupredoxin-like copper-binding protein